MKGAPALVRVRIGSDPYRLRRPAQSYAGVELRGATATYGPSNFGGDLTRRAPFLSEPFRFERKPGTAPVKSPNLAERTAHDADRVAPTRRFPGEPRPRRVFSPNWRTADVTITRPRGPIRFQNDAEPRPVDCPNWRAPGDSNTDLRIRNPVPYPVVLGAQLLS